MNTRAPSSSSSSTPPPPSALLAPGFRFHPTDEELVSYYLRRKILGRPLRVDAIAEVDLYKCEPWDLPPRSRIRSRDVEWYFFSTLDRKHANKARTNRATPQGYWKTTGKDREVRRGSRVVGMKKTLVFHAGRAPRGERTNWVMHEYRIEGVELAQAGIPEDSYVVCRIFQKSGSGPQNGAQYGAPFVEDEWEEEVDGLPVMVENGGEDEFNDAGENEFLQMNDFAELLAFLSLGAYLVLELLLKCCSIELFKKILQLFHSNPCNSFMLKPEGEAPIWSFCFWEQEAGLGPNPARSSKILFSKCLASAYVVEDLLQKLG